MHGLLTGQRVIVTGASVGGVEPLRELVDGLALHIYLTVHATRLKKLQK